MPSRSVVLLALVVFSAAALAQKQEAKGKVVTPEREWVAVIADAKLSKQAPKSGVILDAKTFEKLWKSWRKDEKVPAIDFEKHLVVVTLALGGPNKPKCTARLSDEGNLQIQAVSTLIGGDAFGYAFGVYPREGVKKVNGMSILKT